ncbi:cell envelope integrity protein TolA [Pseudomonas sp.]|uniref:cell envelope integrity protein TolA n=1 Tax=Pseudomonas sp. TaxID=306 RepID=UPI003C72B3EF
MQYQRERSPSESLFWPLVWAVGLHVIMFAMLFVSFAFAPDLPPAKPVVQATLYKLQSQSQATTQTNQKIAGETKKTTAPVYETEQLEQKKAEQEKVAAKAAEQKKAEEAQKAEAAKKADAEKKTAEQKKLADVAKKKAADEAAKKKAAAEAAKKKKADDAKKKAAEASQRKAVEDKKAAALAELLSEDVGRQQAIADTVGDEVAGSLDDLIVMLVSQQWRRPPSARNGMSVEVLIEMLPDGTITNASVTRSSGDSPFDNSAVQAVRNVGRIAEMQQLDRATFDRLYRQRRAVFKPEDLGL